MMLEDKASELDILLREVVLNEKKDVNMLTHDHACDKGLTYVRC